jgi:hypothetical protein
MQNDPAEVVLGLFVPWNQLPVLAQLHANGCGITRDAYANIWKIIEPTLSLHNRNFASNIELLRKSKEIVRLMLHCAEQWTGLRTLLLGILILRYLPFWIYLMVKSL